MFIHRRSNCIHVYTAFGIVTLYILTWWPCSTQVERGMLYTYNLTSWGWTYYCSKHVEKCIIMWIKKFCALSWYLVNRLQYVYLYWHAELYLSVIHCSYICIYLVSVRYCCDLKIYWSVVLYHKETMIWKHLRRKVVLWNCAVTDFEILAMLSWRYRLTQGTAENFLTLYGILNNSWKYLI